MIAPAQKKANLSANRDVYRQAFLGHVHRLLQLGYESLSPATLNTAEEDDITGLLCRRMKQLTEVEPTERWMTHFSVHDQDPVNDVLDTAGKELRRGKRRPKLDIRLVSKTRIPNTRFCVEAKRLYRSDSLKDYLDHEGLGAFVDEYYAQDDDAAGMLGYAQTGPLAEWIGKVEAKLVENSSLRKTSKAETWVTATFAQGPANTYLSRHYRTRSKSEIDIFHTFFVIN
ncbi:MAG: hypothetical protein WC378_03630 [Opitutaceae bacterium]|jgi:hypothetical protein